MHIWWSNPRSTTSGSLVPRRNGLEYRGLVVSNLRGREMFASTTRSQFHVEFDLIGDTSSSNHAFYRARFSSDRGTTQFSFPSIRSNQGRSVQAEASSAVMATLRCCAAERLRYDGRKSSCFCIASLESTEGRDHLHTMPIKRSSPGQNMPQTNDRVRVSQHLCT